MKKIITFMQVICGIGIYGAIGGADNGGDLGQAVVIIALAFGAILVLQAIKMLTKALGRRIGEQANEQLYCIKDYGKCQDRLRETNNMGFNVLK